MCKSSMPAVPTHGHSLSSYASMCARVNARVHQAVRCRAFGERRTSICLASDGTEGDRERIRTGIYNSWYWQGAVPCATHSFGRTSRTIHREVCLREGQDLLVLSHSTMRCRVCEQCHHKKQQPVYFARHALGCLRPRKGGA